MDVHRQRPGYLRGYVAVPQDHGSWVFLFSPLLVGLSLAGFRFPASIFVILGSLAGFLLRQPVSLIVKIKSGWRSSRDLFPAIVWSLIYALIGVSQLIGLLLGGFSNLIFLILPGVTVFAWHLILVSHRDERKQIPPGYALHDFQLDHCVWVWQDGISPWVVVRSLFDPMGRNDRCDSSARGRCETQTHRLSPVGQQPPFHGTIHFDYGLGAKVTITGS